MCFDYSTTNPPNRKRFGIVVVCSQDQTWAAGVGFQMEWLSAWPNITHLNWSSRSMDRGFQTTQKSSIARLWSSKTRLLGGGCWVSLCIFYSCKGFFFSFLHHPCLHSSYPDLLFHNVRAFRRLANFICKVWKRWTTDIAALKLLWSQSGC